MRYVFQFSVLLSHSLYSGNEKNEISSLPFIACNQQFKSVGFTSQPINMIVNVQKSLTLTIGVMNSSTKFRLTNAGQL